MTKRGTPPGGDRAGGKRPAGLRRKAKPSEGPEVRQPDVSWPDFAQLDAAQPGFSVPVTPEPDASSADAAAPPDLRARKGAGRGAQRGAQQGRAVPPEALRDEAEPDATASGAWTSHGGLLALLGFALVAGAYFVIRPGGRWSEADSGLMAQALRAVVDTGQLAPDLPVVYGNGFGYQALSATILAFTGLSITQLQQVVYPIVSAVIVLPIWALYRELTGSARIAGIATLLLLLVPEHLFAVLRASHERVDRALLMTALWLLVRNVRTQRDGGLSVAHVALFLVTTYGLVATNALFGMSFVAALGTAFVGSVIAGWIVPSVRDVARESTRLLAWTGIAAGVVVLVFVNYLYPPLGPSLGELATIPNRLFVIIFGGGLSVDSYAGVLGGWVDPLAYIALSSMDFIVLLGSAIAWLAFGWRWLRGSRPGSFGEWMLWLLFAALASQEVVSVFSDRTGALQGNLAYRAFALFATMATPMIAIAIGRLRPGRITRLGLGGAAAAFAVAALVKSTLDPTLSNKWLFYTEPEVQGVAWADSQEVGTQIWIGPDDRLSAMHAMLVGSPAIGYDWDLEDASPETRTFIVTDVMRLQNARLGQTVPVLGTKNLLYDNGDAQVYRVRPPSPDASLEPGEGSGPAGSP